MTTDIFAPGFRERPYWWEAAAPTAEGSLPLPEETEVAILGAGYAGLSAALELARAGVAVTVCEAAAFGHGASTRNGGAVSSGVSLGRGVSGARNRPDDLLAGARAAFEHVGTTIAREGIACHWEERGRFVGACTRRQYEALRGQAEILNRVNDAGARLVPAESQRDEIASDYYRGGMVVERSGKLHPALYHRGLLDAARGAGATLCANTPVTGIARDGDQFVVATAGGPLRCREVIVATNGYTGEATPALRRRLVPVASHIIATEPLDPGLVAGLMPNGRTISETRRILCYFRQSPDGTRVIFGGRARFTAVGAKVSAPVLYRFMTERFPQLAGVRISHAWTGNVAFTFDYLPHMGVLDGLHYCMGCNGSGIAMASYLGHATGRKILGGANRVNAFDGRDFPTRPLYGGTPWFLPVLGGYYRLRDRIDRWLD